MLSPHSFDWVSRTVEKTCFQGYTAGIRRISPGLSQGAAQVRHRVREAIQCSFCPGAPQPLGESTELSTLLGVGEKGPGQLAGSKA